MVGYSKLFSSIIHSTVWREPNHIRLVWITMLAMKDSDGIVEVSIPGLADAARVEIDECEEALMRLSSPDKYSRTKDFEGRRIEEIDGGWIILNHDLYQEKNSNEDRKRKNAEKQKRYRERLKKSPAVGSGNDGNALRNDGNALPSVTKRYSRLRGVTHSDTDTDTDKNNIYINKNTSNTKVQVDKSTTIEVENDKTSKADIESVDETVKFLPIQKDQLLAKSITTCWPSCTVVDAIAWVQQAKPYLIQLEIDQIEWMRDVSTSRSPNDPVYVQGRNKLHQWLMNCLKNTIRRQTDNKSKKMSKTERALEELERGRNERIKRETSSNGRYDREDIF